MIFKVIVYEMVLKRKKIIAKMVKKLDALNRMDKGESFKNNASEFGVGTSTVSEWKNNRKQIEVFWFTISKNILELRDYIKGTK